jgi:hypothetical protein
MRFPFHLLRVSTLRSEPGMASMAAIAVGMFVGAWLIGPAITHNSAEATAPPAQERTTFEDMVARPDPSPYRAATPAFDVSGPPHYSAAAKARARAEGGGGQIADFEPRAAEPAQAPGVSAPNYHAFDRHRVY